MSFRAGSATTSGDSAGTTLVHAWPVGLAANDIVYFRLYIEVTGLTPTFDVGTWTKITAASGVAAAGTACEQHVFWCRAVGSESGSFTVSWGGANIFRVGMAAAYTGRLTSGDVLDATSSFNAANASTLTCTGITTGNTNADIIGCGGNADLALAFTWSGLTERAEIGNQSFADAAQAGAGASGNKTATLGTTANYTAGLVAFREASAAVLVPVPSYGKFPKFRRRSA